MNNELLASDWVIRVEPSDLGLGPYERDRRVSLFSVPFGRACWKVLIRSASPECDHTATVISESSFQH